MFKANTEYLQNSIFSCLEQLPKEKKSKVLKSEEYQFFQTVFCKINEEDFKVLYSEKGTRPNKGINSLVSALILKERNGWSYDKLMENIDFNILTRVALGEFTLLKSPFCLATLFNFQDRCLKYYLETGIDLLENTFKILTKNQLKALNIKTNIQRGDSFLVYSNIQNYSRLQLLLEVIFRVYRILSNSDQKKFINEFTNYKNKKTALNELYKLSSKDTTFKFQEMCRIYSYIRLNFQEKYCNDKNFKIFLRVYDEHFKTIGDKILIKDSIELNSGMLQSPDDLDATYRKKGKQEGKGFVVHISETCSPSNQLNLITDVCVSKNNVDDSEILNERLAEMKESTPDLSEYHTDGGYGSESTDNLMKQFGINQVQSNIRGNKSKIEIEILKDNEGNYILKCPFQEVKCVNTRKRYKGNFSLDKCLKCKYSDICPTQRRKNYRSYYFDSSDYLISKRRNIIKKLPDSHKNLRANVEASVKEFKNNTKCGKLKIRGILKTKMFSIYNAISINFGRIYRYMSQKVSLDYESCPI